MRASTAAKKSVSLAMDTSRIQPDGWARGEREGYGGPCDVTSHSHSHSQKTNMLLQGVAKKDLTNLKLKLWNLPSS